MNIPPTQESVKRAYNKKKAGATPICLKCRKLIHIGSRGRHILWHLSRDMKINRYTCQLCDYGSYDTTNLIYHGKKIHKNNKCYDDRMGEFREEATQMSKECFGVSSFLQLPARRENIRKLKSLSSSQSPGPSSGSFDFDIEQVGELNYETANDTASSSQYLFDAEQPDLLNLMLQSSGLLPMMKQENMATITIEEDNDTPADVVIEQENSEDFFKTHRFRIGWEVDEVVRHVRAVAEKCNYPEAQIEKIVEIFKKYEVTGLTLSFEEDDLSGFFKECNIVYGSKKAITHILTLMKFQDLKNQR